MELLDCDFPEEERREPLLCRALMWVFSTSSNSLLSPRSELHPLLITEALQRKRREQEKILFILTVSKQYKGDEDSCVCGELIQETSNK